VRGVRREREKRLEQEGKGNLLDKDIRKNGRRLGHSLRSVCTYSPGPEICNILWMATNFVNCYLIAPFPNPSRARN
jgi:hypothetical protein